MPKFSNRDDFSDLEAELRAGRSEPRGEFVQQIATRMMGHTVRTPRRRPRFALASAFAITTLALFASFGGVGYATSSVHQAAKNSAHVASVIVHHSNAGRHGRRTLGHPASNNNTNPPYSIDPGGTPPGASDDGNTGDDNTGDSSTNPPYSIDPGGTPPGGDDGSTSDGNTNPPYSIDPGGTPPPPPSSPPSTRQYSHFVLVCYPFRVGKHHTVRRTILVPGRSIGSFIPPGTLGPCGFGNRGHSNPPYSIDPDGTPPGGTDSGAPYSIDAGGTPP